MRSKRVERGDIDPPGAVIRPFSPRRRPGPTGCVGTLASLFSLFVLLLGVASAAPLPVPRQVLVKLRPGPAGAGGSRLQGAASLQLPDGARVLRTSPIAGWHLVELAPDADLRKGVEWFRRRPEVAVAEPNHRYRLHAVLPNDPQWGWLSGMERIGAPAAWQTTRGSEAIVVAVLDTGIDASHPDLKPNLWRNPGEIPGNGVDDDQNGVVDDVSGADFADGDADPSDDAGHGTHVAGTIGAVGNNGEGVAGVCWNIRLLPVRVGRADGFGDTFALASAFDYVVRLRQAGAGVRVINCSWGGGYPSVMLKEAIVAAGQAGILIVCSAGNDRQDNDLLPAFPSGYDCPEILSVAASTSCDELANFSNYGVHTVDLAAPGRDTLSTYRGGGRYAVLSGTSMAAPHVSGAAALLASARPNLTAAQLRALLLSTVDPTESLAGKVRSGGRLNLARAMQRLVSGDLPATAPWTPGPALGRIEPITRRTDGRWANDDSSEPVISADGRWVAFSSAATNLVPSMDATDYLHVFLKDRLSNTVVRVSQTPAGLGARGNSTGPVISADGRVVAFVSRASNLAAGDANNADDVFVWTRDTGRIELASVRTDGRAAGNGPSGLPALSADGSLVAFQSEARDLVSADRNGQSDVFVRDMSRGLTERVSVSSGGAEANGPSEAPSLSADGRVVAFHAGASNLTPGDANRAWDVFLRDRVTGITELVSIAAGSTQGNSDSVYPILSSNGRRVAFHSLAGNFDSRGGGHIGVFVRDRDQRTLTRANAKPGAVAGGDAFIDGFSGDGRWVCFTSDDPTLAPGGVSGLFRGWLHDTLTGNLGQFGVNTGGFDPDNNTYFGRPNADGRFLVFTSYGSNPVADNGSALGNVYVEDFGIARADLGVRRAGADSVPWIGLGTQHPGVPQRAAAFVERGRTVAFEWGLLNLGVPQAYRLTATWPGGASIPGWVVRITRTGETTENLLPALTGEGWTTPILPTGSNLVLRLELDRFASNNGESSLGVRLEARAAAGGAVLDAVTAAVETTLLPGAKELISRAPDGMPASRNAEAPSVSRDGRWVAFSSEADQLEARNDTNFQSDIFLYDRQSRMVRRVSDASPSDQADADSRYPVLSADGRRMVFQSRASNLVASDTNLVEDIFLKDLETGDVSRLNLAKDGQQANRGSEGALLSADGRHAAFTSLASNLVPGDTNNATDAFVRDLSTGSLELVSRGPGGLPGDGDSEVAAVSGDGRFVLINSYAGNLGAADTNRMMDAYLLDRVQGTLELVSAGTNGVAGNGPSRGTSLSDDGQWVTLISFATDLDATRSQPTRHGFVWHRPDRRLFPVSRLFPLLSLGSLDPGGAVISPGGQAWGVAAQVPCGLWPAADQVAVVSRMPDGASTESLISGSSRGVLAEDHSFLGRFSPDGRYLGFESYAAAVLGEFGGGAGQVFLADTALAGTSVLAQRGPEGPWRGAGAPPPAGPPNVSWTVRGGAEHPGWFGLRLRNDGTVPERLILTAFRPVSGVGALRIEALTQPRQDVTESVFGDGWATPRLQPGESLELEIRMALVTGPVVDGVLELRVRWGDQPFGGVLARLEALADADVDDLPDTWETRWFGSTGKAGAGTDSDGDGLSDRAEWEAGSDPTDPGSGIRLGVARGGDGNSLQVGWPVHAGRYYYLESAVDGAGFEVTGGWYAAAGGRTQEVLVPWVHSLGQVRFRLRVEPP